MKQIITYTVVCLLLNIARAESWLDRPVALPPNCITLTVLDQMSESLPEEDQFFFKESYTAIRCEFVVEDGYSDLTLLQREIAFFTYINGLTPRKMILTGIVLRAKQYAAPDKWDAKITGKELEQRRAIIAKERNGANQLVVEAIKRYATNVSNGPALKKGQTEKP